MQSLSSVYDPQDTTAHKQNKKKCVQILKKGLQIASKKQYTQEYSPTESERQKLIETIECLRKYFPAQKGYDLAKIIHKLFTTLIKNPQSNKPSSKQSPMKRFLESPQISRESMHQLQILPGNILEASSSEAQIEKSAKVIGVIKCYEKYGPSSSKAMKFLKKAGVKKNIESEKEYEQLLEEIIISTIKYLQTSLINEDLGVKTRVELLNQYDSQQKIIQLSSINFEFLQSYIVKQIQLNAIFQLPERGQMALQQNSDYQNRTTFIQLMKHCYNMNVGSQQGVQVSEYHILKLYHFVLETVEKKINLELGCGVVKIGLVEIEKAKINKGEKDSYEKKVGNALKKCVQENIWEKDGIYMKICRKWCQEKQPMIQKQQTYQSNYEQRLLSLKHFIKEQYGYVFPSEQQSFDMIQNLLSKICLKVIEILFQQLFGYVATEENLRIYQSQKNQKNQQEENTDLSSLRVSFLSSLFKQLKSCINDLSKNKVLCNTEQKLTPIVEQGEEGKCPKTDKDKNIFDQNMNKRRIGLLLKSRQSRQYEQLEQFVAQLLQLGFECLNSSPIIQQDGTQIDTHYEVLLNEENISNILKKYIELNTIMIRSTVEKESKIWVKIKYRIT